MNKKSQIQMIETIGVLFVFFILIIIGFVFYAKVQGFGIKAQIEEANQKRAINIVQKASFLPELQCSEENIVKKNCVDIVKVEVVSDEPGIRTGIFTDNIDYYFDIFGYATISVKEIYPGNTNYGDLYHKEPTDSSGNPIWRDKIVIQVPILLKNPLTKKHNFGLMTITTYSK